MRYMITGANRGIGLELTKQLLARGDEVIGTARLPGALGELLGGHQGLRALPLDITDAASCDGLRAALEGEVVDVLINNAGAYGRSGGLGSIDYEVMRQDYEVNTLGALRVLEVALPSLRRGATRRVVNISSQMGSITDNTSGGSYSYRAGKAALNMVTRSAAMDLQGEGFTVFVMHPGWVQTDMGGANAPLDVETSARSMLGVIDAAAPSTHNGAFWSWKGVTLPW
jgi:NAD(P)-dependent dehydrogenase (short-subunit alcohol dehydrogenase family)